MHLQLHLRMYLQSLCYQFDVLCICTWAWWQNELLVPAIKGTNNVLTGTQGVGGSVRGGHPIDIGHHAQPLLAGWRGEERGLLDWRWVLRAERSESLLLFVSLVLFHLRVFVSFMLMSCLANFINLQRRRKQIIHYSLSVLFRFFRKWILAMNYFRL